ncbi:MAG: Cys-rich peptide radical SAM maturase CcpM [Clostridiales bacterium]|jgi:uncharacterized protein|nr:Cys-rich peptide radical SAM maturase CcpM [Clostridiales bacterium]
MAKPLIRLMRTHAGWYFYDVNRNELKEVERETWEGLRRMLAGREAGEAARREIGGLRADGYLSDNRVKEWKHPSTDILPYLLRHKVRKITLQLTQNCNFRCSYCIYSDLNNGGQRTHAQKIMSWETAKKGVDFLLEHSRDAESVDLGFYGGEPLLEFGLLKELVLYAEKVFEGRGITFNITTNGTLLTDEVVDFFVEHDIHLMVSVDGGREAHDLNRRFAANGRGSFDVIMKNLGRIREKYPEYMKSVSLSMVIDPQFALDCSNRVFVDYDFLAQTNVHSAVVDDSYSLRKTVYTWEYIEQNNYEKFLAYLSVFGLIEKERVSPIAREEVPRILREYDSLGDRRHLPEASSHSGPCIPGQMRLLMDVNGHFYPCERVSELSPCMNIGHIDRGFDIDKADTLLNVCRLTPEECRECWALSFCSLCCRSADGGSALSREVKLRACENMREQAAYHLRLMLMLKEMRERWHRDIR